MFNTDLKIMRLINDKISIQYYKCNIRQLIYIKRSKGFSFWDRFKLKSPITQKNATAFISMYDLERNKITIFHFREFLDNNCATDKTRNSITIIKSPSPVTFVGCQPCSNPEDFRGWPLYSNSIINGGVFK